LKPKLEFKRKNIISSVGFSMKSIVWNYFLWILGGKPKNWSINGK